jgi:uncharacterized membrane protein
MMANPVIADVRDTVARATTVVTSATALIKGFNARMQAAVDAAIANGATAAELEPVQTEIDNFDTAAQDLAKAVTENTPAAGGGTGGTGGGTGGEL